MDLEAITLMFSGSVAAFVCCFGLNRRERMFALVAFAFHLICSVAQWWLQEVYYRGDGDAYAYRYFGQILAGLMDRDFWHFAPEIVKVALHLDSTLPLEVMSEGTSTGTMSAIAGFFVFAGGTSLLSLCIVTTWISWFGQLCWYRLARDVLPLADHTAAILGLMFAPSAVFWGAAFEKESLVLGAFGVLGLATYRLFHDGRIVYALAVGVGAVGVAIIKAYTLFPFVLAASTFVYVSRVEHRGGKLRLRPAYLILAAAVAVGGVVAITSVFPEYSADRITETVAVQQDAWQVTTGGSAIGQIGGHEASLTDEVTLVPLALVNSFFRPAPFEANNGAALAASFETAALGVALLIMLLNGRGVIVRSLVASPFLAASLVFVLIFAVAVGLTTSNLGSLSRYRVPMMPFWAMLLLVLHRRRRDVSRELRPRSASSAPFRRVGRPVTAR